MTALLQKAEASDTAATLYDRHHRRILGYCLGQLRDREEANDAVQSTFLYAFSSLQRGVAPRNELAWLFTIAHNVCRTRRRSLRRRSRVEAAVDIDTLSETVGRNDPSREELDGLGSSLAALPETQRRALLLREWQGLSYAEVGARLGLTESAVEAVLFRARRSLAQKLRAADRVASLGGLALFARRLRRIGSLSAGGKAAAATATLAVAVGTGAAIRPLVHPAARPSPVSQPVKTTPRPTLQPASRAVPPLAPVIRTPLRHPKASVAARGQHAVPSTRAATTSRATAAQPASTIAEPVASSEEATQPPPASTDPQPVAPPREPPAPSGPANDDSARSVPDDARPEQGHAAHVAGLAPASVRDVVPNEDLPAAPNAPPAPPAVPPPVQDAVATVASSASSAAAAAQNDATVPEAAAAAVTTVADAVPATPPVPQPSLPTDATQGTSVVQVKP
jgi:RNA polymerase sigma factor (sigma-70 family)